MDENKLAELFKDAARDAPPPSFDVASVRAGSHRATVRQRSAIALGSTMAVVLVFGGVALGTGEFGVPNSTGLAASDSAGSGKAAEQPAAPFDQSTLGGSVDRGAPEAQDVPEGSSTQGVGPSGNVSPSADGTPSGCGTVDRELANALAGELSVASDLATPAGVACPDGSRSASFDVGGGRVYAVVVPSGETLSKQAGVNQASKFSPTKSTVYVVSESPVFADRVDAIATNLAEKF
ncbi:MAG: hypothetical protein ABIQ18_17860 [Umezawaea sp.]